MTEPRVVARTEMIMGLPISIHVRSRPDCAGSGAASVAATVERAFEVIRGHDRIFSPYRSDSVLNAIRAGKLARHQAGAEFAEVLGLAEVAKERTDGSFDIEFGGALDPSGLVKGWSAERAGRVLAELPGDSYVNAGGDIACTAIEMPWRFGIEHPWDPSGLITVVGLRTGAVATSGTAHRGAHILDPRTGRPAAGLRQVTVIGPSLTWADIWATAIVARGLQALTDDSDPLIRRCRSDGYDLLVVTDNDDVFATAGFADHQVPDLPRPAVRPLT